MNSGLAYAVIVASLMVAVWCLATAARDRPTSRGHLVGLGVVELLVLALAATATARLVDGERPAELATFVGYLLTAVLILPAAASLASLERTRWGSVIAGLAALVLPVLVVRLQQVWHA